MIDFLEKIRLIINRSEELSKLKQESFNVFTILRKASDEENLHSSFICELLNPKGSHLMGDSFLRIFLNTINKTNEFDLSKSDEIKIDKEKGFSNGRIDIYIENSKGEIIVIENKIFAKDQPKQLLRYHDFLNQKPSTLLYLTLRGDEASEESTEKILKVNEHYFCISYKDEILEWLENCYKESANHPTVRETIKQYIHLVKKLTGQLSDKKMEKEMIDQIIKNYSTAKKIADNIERAEQELIKIFFKELKDKVEATLKEDKWEISSADDLFAKYANCLNINSKEWDKDLNVNIASETDIRKTPYVIGIRAHKEVFNREAIKGELNKTLKDEYPKESDYCPFFNQNSNLCSTEQKERLSNKEERKELVNKITQQLVDLANTVDLIKHDEIRRIDKA